MNPVLLVAALLSSPTLHAGKATPDEAKTMAVKAPASAHMQSDCDSAHRRSFS